MLPSLAQSLPVPNSIPGFRSPYQIQPLPFQPGRLRGLSALQIQRHYEEQYAEAIRRLNQLERLLKTASPQERLSLRREQWFVYNFARLHELYFGNLGGEGIPKGASLQLINTSFGSYEAWLQDLKALALNPNSEPLWLLTVYQPERQRLVNLRVTRAEEQMIGAIPILVLDLEPHAYGHDYGSRQSDYFMAVLQNIRWETLNERLHQIGIR